MKRQPLKVEAVLVQGVSVHEEHRQLTPRSGWVRIVDLDVKLNAVVTPNDAGFATQLPEPQTTPWGNAAPQPPPHHYAFCGKSSCRANCSGKHRHAGDSCALGRVHCPSPPTYRRVTRWPMRVTIS
jgi:hypothetical protein